MTPPPGADGGLANAIAGSLVMVTAGTLLGTPIGILAGTFLAEYGRRGWLASATRFLNDVLLSAPFLAAVQVPVAVSTTASGSNRQTRRRSAISSCVVP